MESKIKFLLRINEDLKLYIARQARLNDRSLNQEINFRLKLSKTLDEACSYMRENGNAIQTGSTPYNDDSLMSILSRYNVLTVTRKKTDTA